MRNSQKKKIVCRLIPIMLTISVIGCTSKQNEIVDKTAEIEETTITASESIGVEETTSDIMVIYNTSHDHSLYETFGVDEFYFLQNTYEVCVNHDIDGSSSDYERNDILEVYTGNVGDGDSGMVLIHSGDANEPYSIEAHTARAGWKSIYLIAEEDKDYLFELQLDMWEGFGELRYQVYCFGEQVGPNLGVYTKEGMSFTYEQSDFHEEQFYQWAESMEVYLEKAELLLSTQGGELCVEPGNDYERYHAEALLEMIKENWIE